MRKPLTRERFDANEAVENALILMPDSPATAVAERLAKEVLMKKTCKRIWILIRKLRSRSCG